MKLTGITELVVLIENTCSEENCVAEHGLSILIEFNGSRILLDAGQTEAFAANAMALGVDLSTIDYAVLSHGHYDHSGGFARFFQENSKAILHMNEHAKVKYYSANGGLHQIGIPECVLEYTDRFRSVSGIYKIEENVYLVPHNTLGLEKIGEKVKLYKELDGVIYPDDFNHEQSLVLDTKAGLVIFNSCSHGGVINIVREVKEVMSQLGIDKRIYAYLGGLHMMGMLDGQEICTFSQQELDELAEFLKQEEISYIYTGHCTGEVGFQQLKKLYPKLYHLTVGRVI